MNKNTNNDARANGKWQGMNWITQKKRLAIYLRDGMACAYCGATVEDGAKLTLDHVKPHSKGGTNHESNLVCCCHACNSARNNRPMNTFAKAVATYLDTDYTAIIKHVKNCTKRDLKKHLAEAAELIARRGSVKKVLDATLSK